MVNDNPEALEDNVPILPEGVPVNMPELPPQRSISTASQFKAISDPIRTKILGIVQVQPATAKQIADRLGATPGAIGHHIHVLEEAGLVQVVARRLVHGIVSSYYTRTARIFAYNLPPDVTGNQPVALDIITKARDELTEAATAKSGYVGGVSFPHVRVSPERAKHYEERLEALLNELLAEPADPNGAVYGVFLAIFKAPAYVQGQQPEKE
jgi:DNA-binding transcriptional ArsR family regulator